MIKSIVLRLFPQDTPIRMLIEHVEIIKEVSGVMEELVTKYFKHDDISDLVKFISKKEDDADAIKLKFRQTLAKPIKVPFAKTELLYAMNVQDSIINMMKDIAKKMSINEIGLKLDKKVLEDFLAVVQEVQKIIVNLDEVIHDLKYVMASAFARRERKKEEKEIIKIEELETKIDKLILKLGKWAYSRKDKENVMDLMFFNELVLIFAEISDNAKRLAELIRSFLQ